MTYSEEGENVQVIQLHCMHLLLVHSVLGRGELSVEDYLHPRCTNLLKDEMTRSAKATDPGT